MVASDPSVDPSCSLPETAPAGRAGAASVLRVAAASTAIAATAARGLRLLSRGDDGCLRVLYLRPHGELQAREDDPSAAEQGTRGVEVVAMFFSDDNIYLLRAGDPVGEHLGRVGRRAPNAADAL